MRGMGLLEELRGEGVEARGPMESSIHLQQAEVGVEADQGAAEAWRWTSIFWGA